MEIKALITKVNFKIDFGDYVYKLNYKINIINIYYKYL